MRKFRKRTTRSNYIIQILKGVFILTVFVGLGFGVWYVTRLSSLTISEIEISGGDTIKHSVVREVVEAELSGTYIAFIPRTFTYLYPASDIHYSVSAIPRIKDVRIEKEGKEKLVVAFAEYEPHALWCDENSSHCLLVDENGYAFTDAPNLSGGSLLRFVVEDTPLLLRQYMLSKNDLNKAMVFSKELGKEFGFVVEKVYFEQNKDATYTLVGGGKLITNSEEASEVTLNNLNTILDSENFLHLRPDNFQYIDLRFGNKVFVNEEPETASTSTSTLEEFFE